MLVWYKMATRMHDRGLRSGGIRASGASAAQVRRLGRQGVAARRRRRRHRQRWHTGTLSDTTGKRNERTDSERELFRGGGWPSRHIHSPTFDRRTLYVHRRHLEGGFSCISEASKRLGGAVVSVWTYLGGGVGCGGSEDSSGGGSGGGRGEGGGSQGIGGKGGGGDGGGGDGSGDGSGEVGGDAGGDSGGVQRSLRRVQLAQVVSSTSAVFLFVFR